jgi:hypothetical protein
VGSFNNHAPIDAPKTPQVELAPTPSLGVSGFLVVAFNDGFDLRLPILVARLAGDDVLFGVENPRSTHRLRELDWYVLRKTGPAVSKLYQLKLPAGAANITGTWIPTHLDEHHQYLASLTKASPALESRQ